MKKIILLIPTFLFYPTLSFAKYTATKCQRDTQKFRVLTTLFFILTLGLGSCSNNHEEHEFAVWLHNEGEKEDWMKIFVGIALRILIKAILLGAIILLALYLVDINFFKDWG